MKFNQPLYVVAPRGGRVYGVTRAKIAKGAVVLTIDVPLIRYEADKRLDRIARWAAHRMPGRLRKWVVVSSANEAVFNVHPRPDGYAGPDGLTFDQIYDGALRKAGDRT